MMQNRTCPAHLAKVEKRNRRIAKFRNVMLTPIVAVLIALFMGIGYAWGVLSSETDSPPVNRIEMISGQGANSTQGVD